MGKGIAIVLLGACLAWGLFLYSYVLEGGHVSSMIQLTSFLIVIPTSMAFLAICYPVRSILRSFGIAFGRPPKDEREAIVAVRTFTCLNHAFLVMGLLGCTLGLIHVMENLDKPEMIGPGIAIAFVSVIYSVGASVTITRPLRHRCLHQLTVLRHSQHATPVHDSSSATSAADVVALKSKIAELVLELDKKDKAA